jgi:Response regulators consisting of a CheY-like receiver domain and a winged-helix DNA-binding domain
MKKTILIVDDTIELQQMISDVLVMEGFTVITANNGEAGLKMVVKHNPDLIITDLVMPVMNGYLFIAEVRKIAAHVKTPILVFSAKPQKEIDTESINWGANKFVAKPSSMDILLQSVTELIP